MNDDRNQNDIALDKAAFNAWLLEGCADNDEDLRRAKKAIHVILDEYMTARQRQCILCFFGAGMSQKEIAELYGVDKSTVSRTLRLGIKKMYSYLRFTSMSLMDAPMSKSVLSKRYRQKTMTKGGGEG